MRQLVLVAHNIRSAHNVGSMLRTADGLEAQVWLTGYTPYPKIKNDDRLPHLAAKIDQQITKTALGAQKTVAWKHIPAIETAVAVLKKKGYKVVGLEQITGATPLADFQPPQKLAIIVGREIEGLEPEVVKLCDRMIEIPMFGQKESFNVSIAPAMALHAPRFAP